MDHGIVDIYYLFLSWLGSTTAFAGCREGHGRLDCARAVAKE
jgi:hypothetical protein